MSEALGTDLLVLACVALCTVFAVPWLPPEQREDAISAA
jgi:hypothetical protein